MCEKRRKSFVKPFENLVSVHFFMLSTVHVWTKPMCMRASLSLKVLLHFSLHIYFRVLSSCFLQMTLVNQDTIFPAHCKEIAAFILGYTCTWTIHWIILFISFLPNGIRPPNGLKNQEIELKVPTVMPHKYDGQDKVNLSASTAGHLQDSMARLRLADVTAERLAQVHEVLDTPMKSKVRSR